MKRLATVLVFSIIFSCCIGFVAKRANAQGWKDGPVVVYDQRDGRGRSQSFDAGEYLNNRRQLGSLGNDRASSVMVASGYRVRLCDSEGRNGRGSGRCETFNEGHHNLRYQNKTSYIQVTGRSGGWNGGGWNDNNDGIGKQGVTVYDDRDFRGAVQSFGVGRYLFNRGQFGVLRNDEASSVVVQRGYRVRFCENEGSGSGGGKCDEYGEGRFNLRLNDEASYIEVQSVGGGWFGNNNGGWGGNNDRPWNGNNTQAVIVFSEKNQRGEQQTFGVGTFRNDRNQLGAIRNDDATSIVVPRGYRVRICAGEGGGRGSGRCEEYGAGSRNLRYNDEMSFIRVWRTQF